MTIWQLIVWPFGKVMEFCYLITKNYGLSILLFTFFTKIVLFPLALKQQKSTLNMVKLKPYQDELAKKYGNNRQKYSEELNKLYQREGISPMAGCLPTFIQLPLIMLMYTIIKRPLTYMAGWDLAKIGEVAAKHFGEAGVFAKMNANNFHQYELQLIRVLDHDPVGMNFLGFNLNGTPNEKFWSLLLIIPILSGVTAFLVSFVSQKLNPTMQQNDQGGSMKMMMYLMPLMSVWFAYVLPAGLGFYWVISNIFAIGQTYLVNKIMDPKKAQKELEEKMAAEKAALKAKRAESARKKAQANSALASKKKRK